MVVSGLALCVSFWSVWEAKRKNDTPAPAPVVQLIYPTPPTEASGSGCWDSADAAPQSGGWSPERPTYQGDAGPNFNSFNVIRDNPNIAS